MKIIAIIPARGGSKGIPKKNLISIGGKPLIVWTIEAAIKSNIDKIVVTSDDDEILDVCKEFNEVTIVKRPHELAEDTTPTAPVMQHVLKELSITEGEYKYVVLLQPTSPLRTAKHIERALVQIQKENATSLISVCKPDHHPLKSFVKNEKGYIQGVINNEHPFAPRQELPETFQSNGAIYIIALEKFLKKPAFLTEKTIAFLMDPEESIDVDTKKDIKRIENKLK